MDESCSAAFAEVALASRTVSLRFAQIHRILYLLLPRWLVVQGSRHQGPQGVGL